MTCTNIGTQTYRCFSFSDFCAIFPELRDTSFWQEFLDWMDVSSGDAAHTLITIDDVRFSLNEYMEEVEAHPEEYIEAWGAAVWHFLNSPSAPLPSLKQFSPDLYLDLET